MEWLEQLHGQTVAVDTAPFIYYIKENPDYIGLLDPFFMDLDAGKFRVVTSTVTLLEVLVHPLRRGDEALAHRYNDILLSSPNVATLPITYATAQGAADLRARYNIKTPDAIQLAVAIGEGALTLLTNDRNMPSIDDLSILQLTEIAYKHRQRYHVLNCSTLDCDRRHPGCNRCRTRRVRRAHAARFPRRPRLYG